MPSLKNTVWAAAAALFTVVQADYVIQPTSVPMFLRKNWCDQEVASCPIICEQTGTGETKDNSCDPDLLKYSCVCADGRQPNVSEYSLTLPYFTCQEWGNQCVADCAGSDTECQTACREDHPCGAQDPRTNYSSSTTAATATGAGKTGVATDEVFTGVAGQTGSADKNFAPSTFAMGPVYSVSVALLSLAAGFVFML